MKLWDDDINHYKQRCIDLFVYYRGINFLYQNKSNCVLRYTTTIFRWSQNCFRVTLFAGRLCTVNHLIIKS